MQVRKSVVLFILFLDIACPAAFSQTKAPKQQEAIIKSSFGKLPDGREVFLFTLRNSQRMEVKITNYGGIITSIKMPDYDGVVEDVVLGYDSLSGYVKASPLFGALVGRYANRIGKAKFTLEGKEYTITANGGVNSIHGGRKGFDKILWDASHSVSADGPALKLTYLSKDLEEGFPGNLNVEVTYTLTNSNELRIDYRATTDKTTVVNLTNHSYFNLSGNARADVLGHDMTIPAATTVEVDAALIPTGKLRAVAGTPLDFNAAHKIGERIDAGDEQMGFGKGYDHCFVLNGHAGELKHAATLFDPESGRLMDVYTTEPGMQVYSGNHLNGSIRSRGAVYTKRSGICFETGHFPDSPNHPNFPSTTLRPEDTLKSTTVFKFGVR